MAKKKFVKVFRKNKKSNHPAYVIDQDGNMYAYIGVTHSEVTKGKKNVPLEKNPNPKDARKAYVRPVVESEQKKHFGRVYNEWFLSKNDKQTVNNVINKNKKGKN